MLSVTAIYRYYKEHGYDIVVMGASFRNSGEILAMAGCDRLTIAPELLKELADSEEELERKLSYTETVKARPEKLTEAAFLWQHHQDSMAVDKLAQGIRNFAVDQEKLEKCWTNCFKAGRRPSRRRGRERTFTALRGPFSWRRRLAPAIVVKESIINANISHRPGIGFRLRHTRCLCRPGAAGARSLAERALTSLFTLETRLVPDEQPLIEQTLRELVDESGCHLVL